VSRLHSQSQLSGMMQTQTRRTQLCLTAAHEWCCPVGCCVAAAAGAAPVGVPAAAYTPFACAAERARGLAVAAAAAAMNLFVSVPVPVPAHALLYQREPV